MDVSAGTFNNVEAYGGRSVNGTATGNIVTISGGTITGKVVGGASDNTATDNKVILAKGAAAAHLQSATLYGSTKYDDTGLPTKHSGNTLTVEGEKNITLATVKNFDVYDFQLSDVKNGDVILNLLDDTDLGTADVKAEGAITGKRKIYLMKLADGKTLAFTAGDGTTNTSEVTQNDAKTVTFTKTRKVEKEDNNLLLVDNIAYDFGLTSDTMKNGYIFITPADTGNTGATTIDATDVTLNEAGIDGKFLSLSKGDKVYLLKNTADGTLTYTGTNSENQTLNHTYTNDTKDATVTTTGEVAADGNDIILKIDGVKYAFKLTSATKTDGTAILTSTNTGETKIDADDVTLTNDGAIFNKNDKVTLLKTDGTLTFHGSKTLDSTYANEDKTASVQTTGTIAQNGNDLVLTVGDVKYTFTLTSTTKDKDTLLTLSSDGDTTVHEGDVTVRTGGMVNGLDVGNTVTLLKKTNGNLIATDINDTINLSTVFGTLTGTVKAGTNKDLVLTIDKKESLADVDDSYKYIKVVENPTEKENNTITVEGGGNAYKGAIAALAKDENDTMELKENTLAVQGKVQKRAVGANSVKGNVTENNVAIDASATVDGIVAGGVTSEGDATGNTVNINGGTITGNVYGGYSETGAATGNTVTLNGGTILGTVYGGYGAGATPTAAKVAGLRRAPAATSSSNTIDVMKYTEVQGNTVANTYNFTLPTGTTKGATMLYLKGSSDTDLKGATINVKASGALDLYNHESVYLIKKENGNLLTDTDIKQNVDLSVGITATAKATVENQDNNLVLSISGGDNRPSDVAINADTKSLVETRAAQSVAVNMGSDYLAGATMAQVANASFGSDGFAAFGGSSASKMRYETGSYVDANGVAFNAGIVKKTPNRYGALSWGPFFETGHSSYDSYLDNGTHGSGSASYTGGGLLARQELANGLYLEGSLRYGRTKADYSGLTTYDTSSPYFGCHLGVGNLYHMKGSDTLDVYGRYLYSRTGGDSAQLASGEMYDFDAVTSHRLVLGARYTRDYGKQGKGYVGLAYQYEFGGDARAHYQGYDLPSPSVEGSTVKLETGWTFTPSETSPLAIDLGVNGSAGKERGVGFRVGVNYAF